MRDLREVSREILWLINHRVRVPQTADDNWSAIEAQLAVLQDRLIPSCVSTWLPPGLIRDRALEACNWLWTTNGEKPPSARWRPLTKHPGAQTAYSPDQPPPRDRSVHGRRLTPETVEAIRQANGSGSSYQIAARFGVGWSTVLRIWNGERS